MAKPQRRRPPPAAQIPETIDVAAIRARTRYRGGLYPYTQESFALAIGVPAGTVRQWEQKRRKPTGAARVLLALLDRNPALVGQIAIETNARPFTASVGAA